MELETHNKDLFSKLAPEVLGTIFVHCLPPETEPISSKSGPLLLVQVCHRWREVAFGTPSLWQIIHMGREWPLAENPTFILDLFVTNSGNLPLTIRLPFSHCDTGTPERNEAVINRVLNNFHRVLSLMGDTSLFIYFVLKCTVSGSPRPIHAPLLKRLVVTGFPDLTEEEDIKSAHNCINAPNLEELHRSDEFSIVSFSPESLKVLTGLHIGNDLDTITDMSMLCQTNNLVTLGFSIDTTDENIVTKFPSSIYLPNLKHLNIRFSCGHLAEIIRSLHCPAIEKLSFLRRSRRPPLINFIECLTKGRTPPLRYLYLSRCLGTQLSNFYRFRDVEELLLNSSRLANATIQNLVEKEGCEFRLFPRLSSFTMRGIDFHSSQTNSVLTVLRTRCMTSGGTLTYAEFQYCGFQMGGEEQIRALQKELEGTLTISIVNPREILNFT